MGIMLRQAQHGTSGIITFHRQLHPANLFRRGAIRNCDPDRRWEYLPFLQKYEIEHHERNLFKQLN
jgi:hypothetical protein